MKQIKITAKGKPISLRGNVFTGTVVSAKTHDTITVEWPRRYFIPKYERYEMRRTKVQAHNPPEINAKEGDSVKIMGCRPISKTKNFIVIENLGHVKGYEETMEAREESKVKDTKTTKTEVNETPEELEE